MTLVEAIEKGHFENGRLVYVVKKSLSNDDFTRLLTLIGIGSYPEIAKSYDQFEITIDEFSSKPEDHKVEVNGKTYCLVGNKDQFANQFREKNERR